MAKWFLACPCAHPHVSSLSTLSARSVFVYPASITVPGSSIHKGAVYLNYPSVFLSLSLECLYTPSCILALLLSLLFLFSRSISPALSSMDSCLSPTSALNSLVCFSASPCVLFSFAQSIGLWYSTILSVSR